MRKSAKCSNYLGRDCSNKPCIPVAQAFPDVAIPVDFVVQHMLFMLFLVDLLTFDSYGTTEFNFLLTKWLS